MKLGDALKHVEALEKQSVQVAVLAAGQKDQRAALDPAALEKLTTAFPNPAKVEAFLRSMPKVPGAGAVLAAFGNPADLATLVDSTLGGDMRVLAVLAEKGCNRDPAALKTFADTFKGDANFRNLMTKGGLGARPEALAAMLQGGCGGNPGQLKQISDAFANPDDAERLAGVLGPGGLAQAPDALGALVAKGDPAALKKMADTFQSDEDRKKLGTLLTKGGLDGRMPGRPGLLADIVAKGLGGDPARLKDLHAGFEKDMGSLSEMVVALDGADAKGGARMASVIDTLKTKGSATDAEAVKKLGTQFMATLNGQCRAGSTPDMTGGAASRGAAAGAGIPAPPPQIVAAGLLGMLAPGAATSLGPEAMAAVLGGESAGLAQKGAEQAARADGLGKLPVAGPADAAFTADTVKAAAQVRLDTAALLKPPAGPDPAAVALLHAAVDALLDRAAQEPDGTTRTEALAAAKAGGQALAQALRAMAATKMSGAAAGAAAADIAGAAALRPGAGEAEKAAYKALGDAALCGAAASVAAGADPAATAKAASDAVAGLPETDRAPRTKALNDAAVAATRAALAAAAEIAGAADPVPADLAARVASLAQAAATAGGAAVDQTIATNAFAAAKAASEALAAAVRRAAAAARLVAAGTSAEAKKGLAAASSCDATAAMLAATGTKATERDAVADVGKAARSAAISLAAAEEALKLPEVDATKRATDAVARMPGDPAAAATKADDDARNAGIAAAAEAAKIAPAKALTRDLITAAETAAQTALRLAALAVTPAIRKTATEQARDALKAVAAAAERFAKDQLAVARTALQDTQKTQAAAASAKVAKATTDPATATTAEVAATMDVARKAVSDRAASWLAELAATDPGTAAKRDEALAAQAEASLPGASRLARITALTKARDADETLAKKALTDAEALHGTIGPAPNPNAAGVATTCTADIAKTCREANAKFQAANSSAGKWRDSAVALVDCIAKAVAELDAVKLPQPDETKEKNDIAALKAAAEANLDLAKQHQQKLKNGSSDVMKIKEKIQAWAMWINKHGHHGDANCADVVTSLGINMAQTSECAIGGEKFVSAPKETVIRNAASIKLKSLPGHLAGDDTNATKDCTMEAANDTKIREKHIVGRHVRETYGFGDLDDGGPTPKDMAAAKLIAARFKGATKPADGTENSRLINLEALQEKPNSLLPEEVTAANVKDVVQKALLKAYDSVLPAPPPPVTKVEAILAKVAAASNQFWKLDVKVDIPPERTITIGIKNVGGKPAADMVHGDQTNTMTQPDMNAMGRALGL